MVAVGVSDIGIQGWCPVYQSSPPSASVKTEARGQPGCGVIISSLCDTRRRWSRQNNNSVLIRFNLSLRILITASRFDLIVKRLSHVPRFEQRAYNNWGASIVARIG